MGIRFGGNNSGINIGLSVSASAATRIAWPARRHTYARERVNIGKGLRTSIIDKRYFFIVQSVNYSVHSYTTEIFVYRITHVCIKSRLTFHSPKYISAAFKRWRQSTQSHLSFIPNIYWQLEKLFPFIIFSRKSIFWDIKNMRREYFLCNIYNNLALIRMTCPINFGDNFKFTIFLSMCIYYIVEK